MSQNKPPSNEKIDIYKVYVYDFRPLIEMILTPSNSLLLLHRDSLGRVALNKLELYGN